MTITRHLQFDLTCKCVASSLNTLSWCISKKHHRIIVIVATNALETLVKPLLHCQQTIVCVMKGFHAISGGKQDGQKHYTPNTRDTSADPEGWRRPPVVGICKATRECVRLTSGAALWKQKCWKCVLMCQLGVRVDGGLLKSFRYSLRRSSIILKQETGWRYAVFTCKGVLLIIRDEKEPRAWRHSHLSLHRPELFFYFTFFNCWQ